MSIRVVVVASLLALLVTAFAGRAEAQAQAPKGKPVPVEVIDSKNVRAAAPTAAGARPFVPPPPARPKDRDKSEGSGTALALLFWAVALGAVGGSIFVITRRNLIAAVMGMVATFFAVATIYMMLYASFLAVIQMLVYAGAIMVLFVFVVMILNKPEDEPWALVGIPGKVLAALAMLYLTFRLGQTLWGVKPPAEALATPPPVEVFAGMVDKQQTFDSFAWGSTGAVGSNLFDEYLFPFEAVSILLLVAVVGAIAVARPFKDDEEPAADEGAEGAHP